MMKYGLEYSVEAVMQLERLDKTVAKRILKKIGAAGSDPADILSA